ncbi:MAG TPA: hypothetical protein VGP64_11260 [Polyangia bacterium]|jgi:hypothetical protein
MKLATKLVAPFALVLSFAWLQQSNVAHAEEHRGEHHEGHAAPPHEHPVVPRPAPPRFQPHPAGVHPHGPTVRPHAVRVLRPMPIRRGEHPWRHWGHPEFARPVYYWDWAGVRTVTCTAEDSYGDQYPITQDTFAGFGLVNMTSVEDDALDRCYQESGGDQSCFLATCSHY